MVTGLKFQVHEIHEKIQFWSRIIFESCKETNEKLADKEDASLVPKMFSGTKISPPKGTLEDDLPFPR